MNPDQLSSTTLRIPHGQKFILVEEEDEKKSDVPSPMQRVSLRAHPAMGRGIKASKPIKAWLSWYSAGSGPANTAFAANFLVQPSQDSSFASWQAVFDEMKVLEAEAIFNTYYTTDPTVLPANSSNTIVVYDPTSSVTLASVNAGLQFERYHLMRNMIPTATGPKVSPMAVTKDGFGHLRVKLPKGAMESQVQANNSTGLWRPTADASGYDWGHFCFYTSQGGTSAVLRNECFVRMLVEFRVRR